MKQHLLSLLLMLLPLAAVAQEGSPVQGAGGSVAADTSVVLPPMVIIGYLSYEAALEAMPQKVLVAHRLQELRTAYEEEMRRVEDEFNRKYEDFLEGMKDFPRTILLKRQRELQELMQQNISFKTQAQEELRRAEQEAMQPLRTRLNEVIAAVALEHRLAVVVNTDSNACPFIDPEMALSLQEEVEEKLSKEN